jgi:hypothetical protein
VKKYNDQLQKLIKKQNGFENDILLIMPDIEYV